MEEVLERTEGGVRLWPGKLYGALRELDEHLSASGLPTLSEMRAA